jgi:hypothetical protein
VVNEPEVSAGIDLARARAAPGTLHPDADRPILAGWPGCTRPIPCRGPENSSSGTEGMAQQFRELFSFLPRQRPFRERSIYLSPPVRGRPFGANRPASEGTEHVACADGLALDVLGFGSLRMAG